MNELRNPDQSSIDIARYLGCTEVTDEHDVANIETCTLIIGRHQVGHPMRDAALVDAAMDSFAEWAHDYGVVVSWGERHMGTEA